MIRATERQFVNEKQVILSEPLTIVGLGARTAVGSTSAMTFASLRAGISRFQETGYRTVHGEPVIGAPVPAVEADSIGVSYLVALASEPLKECIRSFYEIHSERIALLVGIEESDTYREGFLGDNQIISLLETALQMSFSKHSAVVCQGATSIASCLSDAADLLSSGKVNCCIVGGVQSYLVQRKLHELERFNRLKTGRNSDGLIPGEAACFVGVALPEKTSKCPSKPCAMISGMGFEKERSLAAGEPNKALAWTRAIRTALLQDRVESKDVCFRLLNVTGERSLFLESSLATMRIYLEEMPLPPGWYSAGSLGTVGAGAGALLLGWVATAFDRGYAPGPIALCELASDSGARAAIVVKAK